MPGVLSLFNSLLAIPTPYNADATSWDQLIEPEKQRYRTFAKTVVTEFLARKGIQQINQ